MMFNVGNIKQTSTRVFSRSILLLQKYSPEILTGVGVVGVVTAAVMGAKATLKLEDEVDQIVGGLYVAKGRVESGENSRGELSREKAQVYTKGVFKIAKLYGPSVSLGLVSIGCILAAHGIMRKRNVALVAAYNVLEKSFASYRNRVIEEFGEDKDREFTSGYRMVKEIDEKTGKKTKVMVKDVNSYSPYARWFDEGNVNWEPSPGYNLMWLRAQQNYCNDKLKARGHLFLNEVYEMLDIEHSSEGAVVGWVISKTGDNFVDFGIYDQESERARAFVNLDEVNILLDFNVDGVIYDKI